MNSKVLLLLSLIIAGTIQSTFAQEIPVNIQNIDPTKLQSLMQTYSSQLQSMGISADEANQILIKNQNLKQDNTVNNQTQPPDNFIEKQNIITFKPHTTDTADSSKLDYRRFGKSLFRNKDFRVYKQNTDLVAPENYIIGTGDKINVAIWGYSSYSNSFIVDETGSIFPTGIGKIYLRGLTLRDARALIKSRFSGSYNFANNEIEVSIIGSRNITVHVVGDVEFPGSITLPAYNTLFNILVATGGPTDAGSYRNIYVKRNGSTVFTFDTYEFLLNPDSKSEYFLQDNDYIFVPVVSRIIEVQGEVRRPYEFEILPNENFNKLISFFGGYTAQANTQHIVLKRITSQGIIFLDIAADSLSKLNKDFALQNGDVIIVKPQPTQHNKSITVKGALSFTGEQGFEQYEKISDLIKRNPILEETYLDKAFITRRQNDYSLISLPFSISNILQDVNSTDNYTLNNGDVIDFLSKKDFTDNLNVSIIGAVRNPGTVEYATNMTLSQLIHMVGGLKLDADLQRIEISRIYDGNNQQIKPIPVLVKSIQLSNSKLNTIDANFQILPYDLVLVRSSSSFSEVLNVIVKGEVLFPGTYSLLDKNERISSIINRAGGISNFAYVENTLLYRNAEGKGAVSLRLDKILKKPGGRYDVILKKGDVIELTTKSNIVTITGEVLYPLNDSVQYVNVPFEKGKRARYYVKKYGLGFNTFSKRNRTYVINPGNNVRTCKKYGVYNCYPKVKSGATIVVPPIPGKEQRLSAQRTPVDWNRTIESFTVKITAVATLIVILSRIQF